MVQQKSADILKKKDDQNWNEKVSDKFLWSYFYVPPPPLQCVRSHYRALKTFISFLANDMLCSSIHPYNMVSV